MSTSLLYHAFGVRGYRYVKTEYVEGEVIFTIEQPRESYRCPVCGSDDVIGRGQNCSPIPHRVDWRQAGVLGAGRPPGGVSWLWRGPAGEDWLRRSARHLHQSLSAVRLGTLAVYDHQGCGRHLGISWDVIKEIQKADLQRRFDRPKLKHLRQIAIDEISTAKGHVYLTIVLDLESGAVVHVGRGKGGDALKDFWTRLRRSGAKIEAVATDMSPAYIDAVTTHLPDATLVFDRFHVIKLYNDKLSELRRALYHQLKDTMQKDVLKGVRWLLLKRPENLDPTRNEPKRLQEALRLNEPLAMAYYLKEELNEIWEQDDEETAQAVAHGLDHLRRIHRHPHAPELRQNPSPSRLGNPRLLRLSHLHRPLGRHQQQDQNHETSSLRIPRSRVLPTQNPRNPSNQVRFSRMNRHSVSRRPVTAPC